MTTKERASEDIQGTVSEGIVQAALRVGRKPGERLAWLLDLVQKTKDELAACKPSALIEEIVSFVISGGRLANRPPAKMAGLERQFIVPVRSGLEDLRRGGSWALRKAVLSDLTFTTSRSKSGRIVSGPACALFVWLAFELVDAQREALRECEGYREGERCRRWFVAARPFQKYCSSKCGQAVHNATYQENTPAEHRSRLRRRSYVKARLDEMYETCSLCAEAMDIKAGREPARLMVPLRL